MNHHTIEGRHNNNGPGTDVSDSIGTLWLVERDEHLAHCGLFWSQDGWELRVHIHEFTLLAQQCKKADQVLALAEAWRERLVKCGWRDARPPVNPARGPWTAPRSPRGRA